MCVGIMRTQSANLRHDVANPPARSRVLRARSVTPGHYSDFRRQLCVRARYGRGLEIEEGLLAEAPQPANIEVTAHQTRS